MPPVFACAKASRRRRKDRGSPRDDLEMLYVVEMDRDLFSRRRMQDDDCFALAVGEEPLRNADVFGAAAINRHTASMRDRALECVVLPVRQLLQSFSVIQSVATRAR